MRNVVHWDGDRFFASIEQAADSRLRNRPLVVGAIRRGTVLSASAEAARFGIRPGLPIRRAQRACPQLLVLPGHFDLYEQFFDQILQLCEQTTPLVEPAGIGAAYLDLTGTSQLHGQPPSSIVANLRKTVASWLRVSFSAAIATNKTVARIAARRQKPAGHAIVPPGRERAFLSPLPIRAFEDLNPDARQTLEIAGVRSLGDLAAAPLDALLLAIGKNAHAWQRRAQGIDESPVRPRRSLTPPLRQSIEFPDEIFDPQPLLLHLHHALQRLLASARSQNLEPRRLRLSLRFSDHAESSHSLSLPHPSNLEYDWEPRLPTLLSNAWNRRVRIRAFTLSASSLYSPSSQLSLFPEPKRDSGALLRLSSSIDTLRAKYGFAIIQRGC